MAPEKERRREISILRDADGIAKRKEPWLDEIRLSGSKGHPKDPPVRSHGQRAFPTDLDHNWRDVQTLKSSKKKIERRFKRKVRERKIEEKEIPS